MTAGRDAADNIAALDVGNSAAGAAVHQDGNTDQGITGRLIRNLAANLARSLGKDGAIKK
ncbi:hypothetical protein GCM10023143_04000 [Compostibacter hankyongensis]|uniref:Uncharacterized protein n=1 Tax=Compostibacter hankyongensis TaxID=1007089 RepID=A0ABP8FEK7_9BACT